MKNLILIIICLICFSSYSQSKKKDVIYLLINKNDTLIKKIEDKDGSVYYQIFSTEKVKTLRNNTPIIEGKVWVADTKYDYYVYERYSLNFSSYGIDNKLINKKELESLNYFKEREQFIAFRHKKNDYPMFFFIESIDDCKYVMRKVYENFYE